MIEPELLADTNVFPTPAQMATLFTIGAVPQAAERGRTRMWARFKAGQ
jgi:putrescine transport system substrate-binding protein